MSNSLTNKSHACISVCLKRQHDVGAAEAAGVAEGDAGAVGQGGAGNVQAFRFGVEVLITGIKEEAAEDFHREVREGLSISACMPLRFLALGARLEI
jgi:hypothetical protein